MYTISFTLYGLVFFILLAIWIACIVGLILDANFIIDLPDWLDTFSVSYAWGGAAVILTMFILSFSEDSIYYAETEYNVPQMIIDLEKQNEEITYSTTKKDTNYLKASRNLITGKVSYTYYSQTYYYSQDGKDPFNEYKYKKE